jgi:hypothetical protein
VTAPDPTWEDLDPADTEVLERAGAMIAEFGDRVAEEQHIGPPYFAVTVITYNEDEHVEARRHDQIHRLLVDAIGRLSQRFPSRTLIVELPMALGIQLLSSSEELVDGVRLDLKALAKAA